MIARVLSAAVAFSMICTAQDAPRPLGTEQGFALFQTRCMTCHGNPATPAATDPAVIRQLPTEKFARRSPRARA
jgi:mono/diheme cytochrome c family protein